MLFDGSRNLYYGNGEKPISFRNGALLTTKLPCRKRASGPALNAARFIDIF